MYLIAPSLLVCVVRQPSGISLLLTHVFIGHPCILPWVATLQRFKVSGPSGWQPGQWQALGWHEPMLMYHLVPPAPREG